MVNNVTFIYMIVDLESTLRKYVIANIIFYHTTFRFILTHSDEESLLFLDEDHGRSSAEGVQHTAVILAVRTHPELAKEEPNGWRQFVLKVLSLLLRSPHLEAPVLFFG